jgi:predicted HTH transcriptional regulator
MTKLERIERDIASLAPADLHKLADWLAEFRNAQWDRQIAEDSEAGRLDDLIAKARAEVAAGKTRPL